MNRKVLGKNMMFYMMVGGNPYPLFCGKTTVMDMNQDKIETTHVNSGPHRNWVPGMSDSQITATGLQLLNNDEHKVSANYLMQLSVRRAINTYMLVQTDQDGNGYTITVNAFLTNVNISRDVTQWAQSSVTLQPTEEPEFSSILPDPVEIFCEEQDPIYATLAEGFATYINALLVEASGETITILGVSRAGTTYYETTGTPGNLEFKYNSLAGSIEFQNSGNPGGEPISINYKTAV